MKNYQQYKKYDRKQQVFSIRKLSYGTGSALLTTLLFLGVSQTAEASEVTEPAPETTVQNTENVATADEQPAPTENTAVANENVAEETSDEVPAETPEQPAETTEAEAPQPAVAETTPKEAQLVAEETTPEKTTTEANTPANEPTQTTSNNASTTENTTKATQQPELKNNVDNKISDVSINVKDNKIEDVVDYGNQKKVHDAIENFKLNYYKENPSASKKDYLNELSKFLGENELYDGSDYEASRSNKGLKPSEYEVKAKVSNAKAGDYFTFQHDSLTDLNGNYANNVKVQLPSFYLESDPKVEVARAVNFDNQTKKLRINF
ncbi:triacylglycerol lipase [Staphylococcus microti]|nr:YSIRK-type signal peptide-containing protein [Staphylococcus microti]SUM56979.1 triacylglycerol lipase [Staphylococcus microti]